MDYKRLLLHIKTEMFISARMNFLAIAFPVVQLFTMYSWSDDVSIKQAISATVINYFICALFSFPIGIYRQYLKRI